MLGDKGAPPPLRLNAGDFLFQNRHHECLKYELRAGQSQARVLTLGFLSERKRRNIEVAPVIALPQKLGNTLNRPLRSGAPRSALHL